MNSKLIEINNQIAELKNQAKTLLDENKIDEAETKRKELMNLQKKFNLLLELEDNEKDNILNQDLNENIISPVVEEKITPEKGFGNVIKHIVKNIKIDNGTMKIYNAMTAGSDADGGLTIPQDISTKIKEFRRSEDALENYVNVSIVSTLTGSRVIEKLGSMTPFDNVEEEAVFPEIPTPKFDQITYKVVKKGGMLKLSYELLANTAENLTSYVISWIGKKSKITRNMLIIKKLEEMTDDTKTTITDIDGLKDVFNIKLDPAIATNSIILTNQHGFNWLDRLKDADGRYLLEIDITQKSKRLLFGVYPVVVVSNSTLPNDTTGNIPFYCGDLKEAITIFDRENLTIELEANAGDNWSKDLKALKVREMLDIQAVDKEAVCKLVVAGGTPGTPIAKSTETLNETPTPTRPKTNSSTNSDK